MKTNILRRICHAIWKEDGGSHFGNCGKQGLTSVREDFFPHEFASSQADIDDVGIDNEPIDDIQRVVIVSPSYIVQHEAANATVPPSSLKEG